MEQPLGRYASVQAGAPVVPVQLLGMPVALLAAGQERHDGLLRELSLLALTDDAPREGTPRRLRELVETLGNRYGAVASRPDGLVARALADGRQTVDVTYEVTADIVEATVRLEALMVAADEFCTSERLLTMPRSPLELRFAHWYLEQFRTQVAGGAPQRWDGPLKV